MYVFGGERVQQLLVRHSAATAAGSLCLFRCMQASNAAAKLPILNRRQQQQQQAPMTHMQPANCQGGVGEDSRQVVGFQDEKINTAAEELRVKQHADEDSPGATKRCLRHVWIAADVPAGAHAERQQVRCVQCDATCHQTWFW